MRIVTALAARPALGWLVAAILAIALVASTGPSVARAWTGGAADAGDVKISGCVIRLYTSGPEVHSNAAHSCLGVTSVGVNSAGDLRIVHLPGGPIIACIAAIDETLAVRGIITGCSGGSGVTVVRFYDVDSHKRVGVQSTAVASSASNVWMTWISDGRLL